MNNEHDIHLLKWQMLLAFGAGSVLSIGIVGYDQQSMSAANVLPGLILIYLIYWMLLGVSVSAWILVGHRWRAVERNTRIGLALAYAAVAWVALIITSGSTSFAISAAVVIGIAVAVVFVAALFATRLKTLREGDLFP